MLKLLINANVCSFQKKSLRILPLTLLDPGGEGGEGDLAPPREWATILIFFVNSLVAKVLNLFRFLGPFPLPIYQYTKCL